MKKVLEWCLPGALLIPPILVQWKSETRLGGGLVSVKLNDGRAGAGASGGL